MLGIVSDSTNTSMDGTWKYIRTINRWSPSSPNISSLPHPGWHVCYSAYNSTTHISIKYVPDSDVKLADALSRVNPCNMGPIRGPDLSMHEVHMYLNASPTRFVEIRTGTSKDTTLHALCEIISLGWPENIAHCPAHSMPFWHFRDELSIGDGLILKAQRIVVPKSLHAAALEQVHYAHQVAEKYKLCAKAAVFWCGINHDFDEMVKSCAPCQGH